jgi:hypothetical protein
MSDNDPKRTLAAVVFFPCSTGRRLAMLIRLKAHNDYGSSPGSVMPASPS